MKEKQKNILLLNTIYFYSYTLHVQLFEHFDKEIWLFRRGPYHVKNTFEEQQKYANALPPPPPLPTKTYLIQYLHNIDKGHSSLKIHTRKASENDTRYWKSTTKELD